MRTVAPPVSVRDDALAVIAAKLPGYRGSQDALREIGAAVLADLLIALEDTFGIDLDADEVLPGGTVSGLVRLVEARASQRSVIRWDDERARRALPLFAAPPVAAPEPDPPPARYAARPDVRSSFRLSYAARPPFAGAQPMITDAVWNRAQAAFRRERWERIGLGVMGLASLAGLLVGATWWLQGAGLLR